MDLESYESAKFELAEILRALLARAPKDLKAIVSGVPELFARLAEDRFNLLVVGRFSRGKSSLMNAILGVDRLPTGILPLTSVITSVTYGSREKVWLKFEGPGLPYEIALEKLTEYITEQGNPGNRRRVRAARVELPMEVLRRGFFFVDSPGLGSAIAENTRTTEAFLPEADAVMLVSGFDAPLTQEEERILHWAGGAQLPLFVVLNKQDTVSCEERAQVLQYVQRKIQDMMSAGAPRIFSLSARDGLAAKLGGDAARLRQTGLPELEAELVRFLIEDKARAFIAGMCGRVRQLVSAGALNEDLQKTFRARLAELQDRFSGVTPSLRAAGPRSGTVCPRERARMTECRLCAQVSEALFDHLRNYQYDLATYAEAGERLAAVGGLCSPHTRLYVSLTTDRSVCLAFTPLLKRLVASLADGSVDALLATEPGCDLCALQEQVENTAIQRWLNCDGQPAEWGCICLPHLRKLAGYREARVKTMRWSQCEASALERLVEDMQRYVLKRDGIRRDLTTEEETQAAQRVVAFLAAHRAVLTQSRAVQTQDIRHE